MKKQKFNVGHFPQGTVINYNVIGGSSTTMKGTLTVDSISSNGSNSWCIIPMISSEEMIGINITHVTEIVKRGDGPLLVDTRYGRYSLDDALGWVAKITIKHKSQYICTDPRYLVYWIAEGLLHYSQLLDNKSLTDELLAKGLFTRYTLNSSKYGSFKPEYYTVSKKKLKQAVKQRLTSHLSNRKRAHRQEMLALEAEYAREYENNWTYL